MKEFIALHKGQQFHAEALQDFIRDKGIVCAPSSPTRIMQVLKKTGELHYELVSRSKSLYRA